MAGGNTVHYVYGLGGALLGEYDNAGALIREYIQANGEPLAQIDKSGGTESILWMWIKGKLERPSFELLS